MDITEQELKKTSGPDLIPIPKSKSFSKEISDSKIDYDAQLIQAAQEGNLANVQSALTNGADINATGIANYDGEKVATKALIVASSNGHSEVVKLLLGKGADVDVKTTKTGATALICASNRGDTEVVKLLLNKGADINVKTTNDGWTALIYASYNGDTEVVKLLLDKGADVNVKNITGKTALTYAYSRGDTEVVKLLSSKDTAISTVVASEPRTFASANNPGYSKYPGECMIQCEKENLPLGCSSNIASCVNCLNEFENKYTACLMNNCGISKEDTAFRKFYEPGQVCR